jgi:hypothetical protein
MPAFEAYSEKAQQQVGFILHERENFDSGAKIGCRAANLPVQAVRP